MKKFYVLLVILFLALPVHADTKFNTNLPLPGGSLADAKLQGDTLTGVYASAGALAGGCDQMAVVNTEVTQNPENLQTQNGRYVGGDWSEMWTVVCDKKRVYVPVTFVLDPTGCSYVVHQKGVKLAP